MSKEAHPNIHAVGLTTDIIDAIGKRLRGKGRQYAGDMMNERIKKSITDFVVVVSTEIDLAVIRKGGTRVFHVQPGHYLEGVKYIDNDGKVFEVKKSEVKQKLKC